VSTPGDARLVATLWQLSLNADQLACVVYRKDDGLQLSVESPTTVIVSERFDLQPRAMARAHALRASLERRGWRAIPFA
jgi:hypothetical protein